MTTTEALYALDRTWKLLIHARQTCPHGDTAALIQTAEGQIDQVVKALSSEPGRRCYCGGHEIGCQVMYGGPCRCEVSQGDGT